MDVEDLKCVRVTDPSGMGIAVKQQAVSFVGEVSLLRLARHESVLCLARQAGVECSGEPQRTIPAHEGLK